MLYVHEVYIWRTETTRRRIHTFLTFQCAVYMNNLTIQPHVRAMMDVYKTVHISITTCFSTPYTWPDLRKALIICTFT